MEQGVVVVVAEIENGCYLFLDLHSQSCVLIVESKEENSTLVGRQMNR